MYHDRHRVRASSWRAPRRGRGRHIEKANNPASRGRHVCTPWHIHRTAHRQIRVCMRISSHEYTFQNLSTSRCCDRRTCNPRIAFRCAPRGKHTPMSPGGTHHHIQNIPWSRTRHRPSQQAMRPRAQPSKSSLISCWSNDPPQKNGISLVSTLPPPLPLSPFWSLSFAVPNIQNRTKNMLIHRPREYTGVDTTRTRGSKCQSIATPESEPC
jgi:hypothetical protein